MHQIDAIDDLSIIVILHIEIQKCLVEKDSNYIFIINLSFLVSLYHVLCKRNHKTKSLICIKSTKTICFIC